VAFTARQRRRLRRGRHAPAGPGRDAFAPQLSFFFNAHNDLIERSPSSGRPAASGRGSCVTARRPRPALGRCCRFHVQTAGSIADGPAAGEQHRAGDGAGAGGILGGCQSLHTNSMDEALALRPERAVRIALRTQQVLAYESGVADTVDPSAAPSPSNASRVRSRSGRGVRQTIDDLGGSVGGHWLMQARDPDAAYRWSARSRTRRASGSGSASTSRHRRPAARQSLPARRRHRQRRWPSGSPAAPATRDADGRAARSTRWSGRPRPRQPHAAAVEAVESSVTAGRDLWQAARRVRRAPALGGRLKLGARPPPGRARRRRLPVPARAGMADRAGSTFALMANDFVTAFRPVEGLVVSLEGLESSSTSPRGPAPVGQEYTIFRKATPSCIRSPAHAGPLRDGARLCQVVRVLSEFRRRAVSSRAATPAAARRGRRPHHPRPRPRAVDAHARHDVRARRTFAGCPFLIAAALEGSKRFLAVELRWW